MATSNRKSLDQSLAAEFVFGQKEFDFKPDAQEAKDEKRTPAAIPLQPVEKTIRFTIDLSLAMHKKLSLRAAEEGRKKAEIVRELLERALTNQ